MSKKNFLMLLGLTTCCYGLVGGEVVLNEFSKPTTKYHDNPDIYIGITKEECRKLFSSASYLTFDEPEFARENAISLIKNTRGNERIALTGFQYSTDKNYLLSAPGSLKANGEEGKKTGQIIFSEPVSAAGVGVCFATGSLKIAFCDEENMVLAEYLVHGQPDPEQNSTWQDYYIAYKSPDELSSVKSIAFTRLNITETTAKEYAIDNLAWIPIKQGTNLNLPAFVESDFRLLDGAGRTETAPQKTIAKAMLKWDGKTATWNMEIDNVRCSYTFRPEAGLDSISGQLNNKPAVNISNNMVPMLGTQDAQQTLLSAKTDGNSLLAKYRWANDTYSLDVDLKAYLSGGSLVLNLSSEQGNVPLTIRQPWPVDMHIITNGGDSKFRYNENIAFFGFCGNIGYLEKTGYFYGYQPDWTQSNSSTFGEVITYLPSLGEAKVAPLRETITLTLSDTLAKVLPSIPNPTSPYRRELGSRMIMEYWYGHFNELGELLEIYHKYGMNKLLVLLHRWQNAGFDRKLPTIMPPSIARGGQETLKAVIDQAKSYNMRIALHDNYKDFYPDSPQWNPDDLMLTANGEPQRAWADSCEMAPSKIRKYAAPNMKEIKEKLGPNAGYLDVHSAHLPWWRTDYRAGVPKSAMFAGTREANNDLWQLARDSYNGPVFGESSPLTSWVHTGYIDAVMGATTLDNSLIVDFQLLKIRPLATNHGAGYFERWNKRGYVNDWELAPLTPEEYARYSLHEMAFLTSPTIDDKMKNKILPAATLYYQRRKLVERLIDQAVTAIYYYTPQGKKMTSSQAVLLPKSKSQRLEIRFADDSVIYLNFGKSPWSIRPNLVLAPLGLKAEGKDFEAETNCVNGLWSDYWRGPTGFYLNSRNYDWALEPQSSVYHGRAEGGKAYRHNDNQMVRRGILATNTAVSLEPEADGSLRLRFFPRNQAGVVEIAGEFAQVLALDDNGDEVKEVSGDEIKTTSTKLVIKHRNPGIWSYRLWKK